MKIQEKKIPKKYYEGCKSLVENCAALHPNEKVLIVSDNFTQDLGRLIKETALEIAKIVNHETIPPLQFHGEEPPEDIAEKMMESDVVFGMTKMSLAHSRARYRASSRGIRYLSLPDYSLELLSRPSLQVDFRALGFQADRLANYLSYAKRLCIYGAGNTCISLIIEGRNANSCPGWCKGPGTLASPPDAETNIAPVEHLSNGKIIIDGSIPCAEFGLLQEPITLTIRDGSITNIEGRRASVLAGLLDRENDDNTRVLAEVGIGLNPKAELCGIMLEDEGCLGTIHFGFGSNSSIGGKNYAQLHLDMVIRTPSLEIDGNLVIREGEIII